MKPLSQQDRNMFRVVSEYLRTTQGKIQVKYISDFILRNEIELDKLMDVLIQEDWEDRLKRYGLI